MNTAEFTTITKVTTSASSVEFEYYVAGQAFSSPPTIVRIVPHQKDVLISFGNIPDRHIEPGMLLGNQVTLGLAPDV